MKFLCIGAGAIGIYVGGSLELSGNLVGYLIKPIHFEVFSEKGIQITQKNIHKNVKKPLMANDLRELILNGFDTLLVAVKSYDTEQIIKSISPYKEKIKCCVCLQNGVDNENGFVDLLGKEKVIYASVASAIKKLSATHVVIEKNRGIGLSGISDSLEKVYDQFKKAGLKPRIYKDPMSMKWSKMISNLFSNATSAILDMSPAEVYSQKQIVDIEIKQIKEALDVMNVMGLKVVNLPGIPLNLLTGVIKYAPKQIVYLLLRIFIGRGRGNKLPSLLEDIKRNSVKTEVEFLNGAVVKYADLNSINAPINKKLTEIVNAINKNPQSRQSYSKNPDFLFSQLQKYY